MKKIAAVIYLTFTTSFLFAQLTKQEISGTTNKLVEGTELKNGKFIVKPGYEATLSEDKKTVTVSMLTGSGLVPTGQYYCQCFYINGECLPQYKPGNFSCASSNEKPCMETCEVYTRTAGTAGGKPAMQKTWKKLILTRSASN